MTIEINCILDNVLFIWPRGLVLGGVFLIPLNILPDEDTSDLTKSLVSSFGSHSYLTGAATNCGFILLIFQTLCPRF